MESSMLLPAVPIIAFSKTLKSSLRRQILSSLRHSPRLLPVHSSSLIERSISSRQLFLASVLHNSPHLRRFASLSSSAAVPLFGGGDGKGGDGDAGGRGGGNGGDDGLRGEKEKELGAKTDEASSPNSDVIILDVGGMSCGGCAASVKRILESQPQVRSATVNLATETAVVWASCDTKIKNSENWKKKLGEKLAEQLTLSGFKSNLRDSTKEDLYRTFERKMDQKLQLLKESGRELAVSWALCTVCLLGHISHLLGTSMPSWIHVLHSTKFHLSLSLFTFVVPGRKLILDGIKCLMRGNPNMNTLVGLGALSSFAVSSVAALVPKLGWKTFFEEPIMLIAFVLLGKNLELRAKLKATSDMTGLLNILPKKARLVVTDGDSVNSSFVEVACNSLSVGDHVVVLPGDRMPADGVVKSGRSTVDESSLTGEAMPVTKLPGAEVTAGSINLNGKLTIEVKRPGGQTVMADIVRLVEEAQTREAPVQRLADKVAGNFTYGVMALSAATFTFWSLFGSKLVPAALQQANSVSLALQLSCSVLVIACPCALGLATPTAVLVGTSLGARQGLLLRGGNVLEKFSEVDTIVFDKTGTLTTGKPVVTKVMTSQRDGFDQNFSENEILSLAAGVECNTNHPLGKAITEAAHNSQCLSLKAKEGTFKEQPGSGAVATVGQNKITVGTLDWLKSHGVVDNPFPDAEMNSQSVVYVGIDSKLAGIIYFEDKLRDDARQVINTLSKQGISTYMLSGDKRSSAEHIASLVGIPKDKVMAGVKPEEKRKFVSELQKVKRVVAMVGDGINDTAALAASDVGIAMGEGVGAASDVSPVVLMGNRLSQLIDALELSKETMKTVKQNLWWAFLYNIVGLPIAAGALLPVTGTILTPSIAGALMGFSSVGVMANSLLLRVKLGANQRPNYNSQLENNKLGSDVVLEVSEETVGEKSYTEKWKNT